MEPEGNKPKNRREEWINFTVRFARLRSSFSSLWAGISDGKKGHVDHPDFGSDIEGYSCKVSTSIAIVHTTASPSKFSAKFPRHEDSQSTADAIVKSSLSVVTPSIEENTTDTVASVTATTEVVMNNSSGDIITPASAAKLDPGLSSPNNIQSKSRSERKRPLLDAFISPLTGSPLTSVKDIFDTAELAKPIWDEHLILLARRLRLELPPKKNGTGCLEDGWDWFLERMEAIERHWNETEAARQEELRLAEEKKAIQAARSNSTINKGGGKLLKGPLPNFGLDRYKDLGTNNTVDVTKKSFRGSLINMPIKDKDRALAKASDDYSDRDQGPPAIYLGDIVRSSIVCISEEQIHRVLGALFTSPGIEIINIKNRFHSPTPVGYRDFLINAVITFGTADDDENDKDSNNASPYPGNGNTPGFICELQIHHIDILRHGLKEQSYEFYTFFRNYFGDSASTQAKMAVKLKVLKKMDQISQDTDELDSFIESYLNGQGRASRDVDRLDAFYNLLRCTGEFDLAEMVQYALINQLRAKNHKLALAKAINAMSTHLRERQRFEEALPFCEEALALYTELKGRRDAGTAKQMMNLGALFSCQNYFSKALKLFDEAYEIYLKELGADNTNTMIALQCIAETHEDLRDWVASKKCYELLLDSQSRVFGKNSPDVMKTLNNLGLAEEMLGNYRAAIERHELALQVCRAFFGINHLNVGICIARIANQYDHMGQYRASLDLYKQALDIALKVENQYYSKGKQNANKLIHEANIFKADTLDAIGTISLDMGLHSDAKNAFEMALNIRETVYNATPFHPLVAASQNNLAEALLYTLDGINNLSILTRAQKLIKAAATTRQKLYGSSHISSQQTLNNEALVMELLEVEKNRIKKEKGTEELTETVTASATTEIFDDTMAEGAVDRDKYDLNHSHAAGSVDGVENVSSSQLAPNDETIGTIGPRDTTVGQQLDAVLNEANELCLDAIDHRDKADYNLALEALSNALKIVRNSPKFNENHIANAIIMSHMGSIYEDQGRYREAVDTFQAVLDILTKLYGSKIDSTTSINLQTGPNLTAEDIPIERLNLNDLHPSERQGINEDVDDTSLITMTGRSSDSLMSNSLDYVTKEPTLVGSSHPGINDDINGNNETANAIEIDNVSDTQSVGLSIESTSVTHSIESISLPPFVPREYTTARLKSEFMSKSIAHSPRNREELDLDVLMTDGALRINVQYVDNDESTNSRGGLFVKSFKKDSAAQRQGLLRIGDELISANGVSLRGMNMDAFIATMKGIYADLSTSHSSFVKMRVSRHYAESSSSIVSTESWPNYEIRREAIEPVIASVVAKPLSRERLIVSGVGESLDDNSSNFEELDIDVLMTDGALRINVQYVDNDESTNSRGGLFVKSFKKDSAAQRQGLLRIGDELISANGVSLRGMNMDAFIATMKGICSSDVAPLHTIRLGIMRQIENASTSTHGNILIENQREKYRDDATPFNEAPLSENESQKISDGVKEEKQKVFTVVDENVIPAKLQITPPVHRIDIFDETCHNFVHPHIAQSLMNLAGAQKELGEFNDALTNYTKSRNTWKAVRNSEVMQLSDKDCDTEICMATQGMAQCLLAMKSFDDAMKVASESYALHCKLFGDNHPDTTIAYNTLAMIRLKQGKLEKSLNDFVTMLKIRADIVGTKHQAYSTISNNCGVAYYMLNDLANAGRYFNYTLDNSVNILGMTNRDTALAFRNFARVFKAQGEIETPKIFVDVATKITQFLNEKAIDSQENPTKN